MSIIEQHAAARSFREAGNALETLGRGLSIGRDLIQLGRSMRRLSPGELKAGNLFVLRAPLDAMRVLVDNIEGVARILRELLTVLDGVVGVDN